MASQKKDANCCLYTLGGIILGALVVTVIIALLCICLYTWGGAGGNGNRVDD